MMIPMSSSCTQKSGRPARGVTRIPIYLILAQYTTIPKIPGYVPEHFILVESRILYIHISTYFNNKILCTKSKMVYISIYLKPLDGREHEKEFGEFPDHRMH
jgi:hypothetical protein